MNLLIKSAHIIDPLSNTDTTSDILIEDGIIKSISDDITPDKNSDIETIDATDMVAMPGLCDIHVHFRDPGWPDKETIESGCLSALAGGVTTVVCMANTNPVTDNPDTLKYILDKADKTAVTLLQNSAITKGLAGKELVDTDLMLKSGACGFSDDGIPIEDVNVMINALKAACKTNSVLSLHEELPSLRFSAGVNFGSISKKLGVLGAPNLSESALIERDIMLQGIYGGRVHFQHVSTKESYELIKKAKAAGATITAEVTPQHLLLSDEELLSCGSNAKLNPPLRTKDDIDALIQGVFDGTFDCIATDHAPHTAAEKALGIEKAPSGLIGLETSLSVCYENLVLNKGMSLTKLVELMSINPASLYEIKKSIAVGNMADITLFDTKKNWTANSFVSKSSNSPFLGKELKGKVSYTICNNQVFRY